MKFFVYSQPQERIPHFFFVTPRDFFDGLPAQVIPVLEQQLRDVEVDLESQEGLAKELTSQVHSLYSRFVALHTVGMDCVRDW